MEDTQKVFTAEFECVAVMFLKLVTTEEELRYFLCRMIG